MLAHVFERIEKFFQDKCIFQLYDFLPGVKITFWTAVVPAVAGATPEVILTPPLARIRAWLVVPVIYCLVNVSTFLMPADFRDFDQYHMLNCKINGTVHIFFS